MKKFLSLITAAILTASALTANISAATVTMYAQDGRTITVQDYQVSAYQNVGWYLEPFVTMYSLDGRTIKVQKFQIADYQNVGWFTENDMYWLHYIKPELQYMYDQNDYVSLYFSAQDRIVNEPYSPIYTDALYTYRTRAMDKWRVASGCPVGVTADESEIIEFKSDGTVRFSFNYTNISYKPIIAIKGERQICDVFGNVLHESTFNIGAKNDMYIAPGETAYDWGPTFSRSEVSYYNLSSARFIRNFRILEVVFADGTKWVNPSQYSSNGTLSKVYLAGYVFTNNDTPAYMSMWKF